MIYRVSVPMLPPMMGGAVVDRWHVAEGDEIDFGDPVCDLLVRENYKAVRTQQPNRLKRFSMSSSKVKTMPTDIRVRVLSHDRGVLRSIAAPPGAEIREGDRLGVAASSSTDPIESDPSMEMRLIAEMVPQADNFDEDDWED